MLSSSLYLQLEQEVSFLFCLCSLKFLHCLSKNSVNNQGNVLITKHILTVITSVLASKITPLFFVNSKQDVCTQKLYLTNVRLKIYDIKINYNYRSLFIAKNNDITSINLRFCFLTNLSLQKKEHQIKLIFIKNLL